MSDLIEKIDDLQYAIDCTKLYHRIIKSLKLNSIKQDEQMNVLTAVVTRLVIDIWNDQGGYKHGLIEWIEEHYDFYTDKDEDNEEKAYPPKPKYTA